MLRIQLNENLPYCETGKTLCLRLPDGKRIECDVQPEWSSKVFMNFNGLTQ